MFCYVLLHFSQKWISQKWIYYICFAPLFQKWIYYICFAPLFQKWIYLSVIILGTTFIVVNSWNNNLHAYGIST